MLSVIRAVDLRKSYGGQEAVRGIDFEVQAGECFGLLGPNGAGKTSTIRMICCRLPRTGGQLQVLGLDPKTDGRRIRARLGVVPQENTLDPYLTVSENLYTYAMFYGLRAVEARRRAARLLDFMDLSEKAQVRTMELSGGMKRRLVIARALLNEPDLVVLDEPTTGLDPHARLLVWERLSALKNSGVTLLLTTHYMDEAARLCDRLAVMDQGRIIARGTPAQLVAEHVGPAVVELPAETANERLGVDGLRAPLLVRQLRVGQTVYLFNRENEALLAVLREQGILRGQTRYLARATTLEDVFLVLTGRALGEETPPAA